MAEVETIHVRGEGGAVIAMDLPVPEPIAQRLARGQLVLVNADGTARADTPVLTREAAGEEHGADQGSDLAAGQTPPPAKNAAKSEWIAHVVARGLLSAEDAAVYTKGDLIDLAEGD